MTTVRHVDFDQQETAPKGKTVKAPPSKVVEAGKKESLTVASPLATATTTAAH